MNASPAVPMAATARVLATYSCDEGLRQLVGERVDGKVALRDVPVGDYGRVCAQWSWRSTPTSRRAVTAR